MIYEPLIKKKTLKKPTKLQAVLAVVLIVTLTWFIVGFVQYFSRASNHSDRHLSTKELFIHKVSSKRIAADLRVLTKKPHPAGTSRDFVIAHWIKDRYREAGLDDVQVVPYQVLLPSPNRTTENTVSVIDENGVPRFKAKAVQPNRNFSEEIFAGDTPNTLNIYSGSGVVEGKLVYGFYGRAHDYRYLESKGINLTEKIALIRYRTIFRGSSVATAEKFGISAIILYIDPEDKVRQDSSFTSPESLWLPGINSELDTIFDLNGDLLTPFYPAIESAYRISEQNQHTLLKIPVQFVGYEEAQVLLRYMSQENAAPKEWTGFLNASYSLGPNLLYSDWKVRVNVTNPNQLQTIYNVIGILHGNTEPDRYVILGNHYDASHQFELNSSSGTASLIEIARVIGGIKQKKNWRPRRSLLFCSWGAKEYGLIGSNEWIEQHYKILSQRAVAYLNVDIAVSGNQTFWVNAFPTLRKLFVDVTKLVPNPNSTERQLGLKTVFDSLYRREPYYEDSKFLVGNLGGGSDYEGFAYLVGIPAADIGYDTDNSLYPTYHTLNNYDHSTSELMEVDYHYHQAIARVWGSAALELADSAILPLDIETYSSVLNESFISLANDYERYLKRNGATLKYFRESVDLFSLAVKQFIEYKLNSVNQTDDLAVRRMNDKLMYLERYFIDPRGLPNHPESRHIVFSALKSSSFGSETFAGLFELLARMNYQCKDYDPVTWTKLLQHLSVIAFLISEAGKSLTDVF